MTDQTTADLTAEDQRADQPENQETAIVDAPIVDRPDLTHADGYPTFEVFRQRRTGEAFTHVGQVEAPDHDTALLVAKEHYSRRETCSALWVVDRRHVHEAAWGADVLSAGRAKSYRRVLGRRDSLDVLQEH